MRLLIGFVVLAAKPCLTILQLHGLYSSRLLCPWDFLGKDTEVGCHSHLQGNRIDPGIEPVSPVLAGRFFTVWASREAQFPKVDY